MDIKQKIISIIKKNIKNHEDFNIFLFGSRATKKYKHNSDYDIWIIKKNKKTQNIKFTTLLKTKRELNELPCLIDFIDFNRVDDEVFKNLALKKTEIWT